MTMHAATTNTPRGGTELQLAAWRAQVPAELQAQVHLTVSALPAPARPLKPHIFWAHQAADQPSVQNLADPLVQRGIDAFVFVSEWQRNEYITKLNVPPERSYVVRNAIEPIPAHRKPNASPLRLIYTSTPFRGLDVLLEAFVQLAGAARVIELHIYSGMTLYGRPADDVRYHALYERARQLPGVYYHGVVRNSEVRQALTESHIFAYPCTWEETSCVALIEALAAGCVAVVPDLAALPETACGYARLYSYTADTSVHVARFKQALESAINTYYHPETVTKLAAQVTHCNTAYSWQTRVGEWEQVLTTIIQRYGRTV